jgi:hypothetical protein
MLYSLLFFVHLKNFMAGKTTNERFSKKAQGSFSEAGGDGATTYLDQSESESLMEGSHTHRGSQVGDDEDQEGNRRSSKRRRTTSGLNRKRSCF